MDFFLIARDHHAPLHFDTHLFNSVPPSDPQSLGIGSVMARALALNGESKVFIIGRREEALKKTAASVPSKNIIPIPGDVTSKESL